MAFSNSLCFPCLFPVQAQTFPVPIYVICEYNIPYAKLTKQNYPASNKNWKCSQQILKYILPLESGNLQIEHTKFPVFWQSFQIPCVFPDFFVATFPVFSCTVYSSGYPDTNIYPHISLSSSIHILQCK